MSHTEHEVTGSEHIAYLAALEGYRNWKTLWQDNGGLSGKRKNPHILFHGDRNPSQTRPDGRPGAPGDMVKLTDPTQKEEPGQHDTHNPHRTGNSPLKLRIRVLDDEYKPLKNAPYTLLVDGIRVPFNAEEEGSVLDGDGVLDVELPGPAAQDGLLTVDLPQEQTSEDEAEGDSPPVKVRFHLQIGRLDPILVSDAPDAYCTAGVQQRLNNLAFDAGPVDGINGSTTRTALKSFGDRFIGGPEVDDMGDPIPGVVTQEKLEEYHDQGAPLPAMEDK